MKYYCAFVLLLDALLGLVATVVFLLWARGILELPPAAGEGSPQADVGMATLLLAVSVLAANLLALILALVTLRDRTIRMPIDEGAISVAVTAVEQSLARTACALPDVRDVQVRVLKQPGHPPGLRIRTAFTAWEGTAVQATMRRLQDVLRMRVEDIVGTDVPLQFDIKLAGIILKEPKKSETEFRRKKSKERQAQPYGGPVYPIDEL